MKTLGAAAFVSIVMWASSVPAAEPIGVSIIQLIATPDKFNGKFVRVTGFLHLEFEGNALYVHREDFQNSLYRNAIWFEGNDATKKDPNFYTDRYVLVEGRFDSKRHGHMGLFSGELYDIGRVVYWGEQSQPSAK